MSKFTVIGDPHAKSNNLDKIGTLFNIVEDLGFPAIWLGDFLDTKEVIRGKCLNLIYQRLKESKLHHIIIIGNHDWFNLECEDHSLQLLKELENVTIVDEYYRLEDSKISILPYIHDEQKLKNAIKGCYAGDILIGHFEFPGFDYGNGHICESGYSHTYLATFRKIISGHFHKYQQKDHVTYLGTPFSHSFGESNQEKYIGILDSNNGELELVKTNFPQHITETINCDEESSMEFYESNDFVRIILTGTQENIDKFKSLSVFYDGLKIMERPSDTFNNDVQINEAVDNNVKFKSWAEEIKGLDKETTDLGLQILEAVK